jgi:hypothetical protein
VHVHVVAVKNVPSLGSLVPHFDIGCSIVVDGTENRTAFELWDQVFLSPSLSPFCLSLSLFLSLSLSLPISPPIPLPPPLSHLNCIK